MISYEKIRISKFGVNINSAYAGTYPFKVTSTEGKAYYLENFDFSEFLRKFENKPLDVEITIQKKRRFPSHFFKPAEVIVGAEVNTNDLLNYYANQDIVALRGVIPSSNNKIFNLTKLVSYGITKENSESSPLKSKEIYITVKGGEMIANSDLFNNNKSAEIIVRGKLRNAMTSTRALDGVSDSSVSDYELEMTGWYFVKVENTTIVTKIESIEKLNENNQALIPVYPAEELIGEPHIFIDTKNDSYDRLINIARSYGGKNMEAKISLEKLNLKDNIYQKELFVITDFPK